MRICAICGKKKMSGNNRSHSNIKTKRVFKPNLQKSTIDGKKMLVCTKCLKARSKK